MPDDTRLALNQDRRRIFGGSRAIAFLCECADEDCRASVVLTPRQYDLLRGAGDPLLHPGHAPAEAPSGDSVLAE